MIFLHLEFMFSFILFIFFMLNEKTHVQQPKQKSHCTQILTLTDETYYYHSIY